MVKEYFEVEEDIHKSELQKILEAEGWRFLTNTEGKREIDARLKDEYIKNGFKEVLVTVASDLYARHLHNFRAVYVREEFIWDPNRKHLVPESPNQAD